MRCSLVDLLLAKLEHRYHFDYNSPKLTNSFLSGRKLRTKTGFCYSPYLDLLLDVPHGRILGPLFFNIYMCNLFLCDCESDINNYEEYTSLYVCETNMDLVLNELEKDTSTVFTWFQKNYLKTSGGKSHLLTTSDNVLHINVGGALTQ